MNDHPPGNPTTAIGRPVNNAAKALLVIAGIGLALAFFVKESRQNSLMSRRMKLLKDLEKQVASIANPAMRRASSLADEGAKLFESARGDVKGSFYRARRDGRRQWKRLFS